jgi:hypothetical protein
MTKNWKAALASLLIAGSSFGAGAVFTASAHAQTFVPTRSERGSAQNLMHARRRLEGIVDQLQRDRHDYGGHRVAAIGDLQQAREQLDEAIEYDRAHPGQ